MRPPVSGGEIALFLTSYAAERQRQRTYCNANNCMRNFDSADMVHQAAEYAWGEVRLLRGEVGNLVSGYGRGNKASARTCADAVAALFEDAP